MLSKAAETEPPTYPNTLLLALRWSHNTALKMSWSTGYANRNSALLKKSNTISTERNCRKKHWEIARQLHLINRPWFWTRNLAKSRRIFNDVWRSSGGQSTWWPAKWGRVSQALTNIHRLLVKYHSQRLLVKKTQSNTTAYSWYSMIFLYWRWQRRLLKLRKSNTQT